MNEPEDILEPVIGRIIDPFARVGFVLAVLALILSSVAIVLVLVAL